MSIKRVISIRLIVSLEGILTPHCLMAKSRIIPSIEPGGKLRRSTTQSTLLNISVKSEVAATSTHALNSVALGVPFGKGVTAGRAVAADAWDDTRFGVSFVVYG
jgi:hypothetical protein